MTRDEIIVIRASELREMLREILTEALATCATPSTLPRLESEHWVSSAAASKITGFSAAHLARLRMTGNGPPFHKTARGKQGHVRYSRADLDAWMTRQRKANTSQ